MKFSCPPKDLAKHHETEVICIVEGHPESGLAQQYARLNGVDASKYKVVCYEGNGNLSLFSKQLAKDIEVLPKVRSIGVIADSETDPQARIGAFIDLGKSVGFANCEGAIRRVGRYQFEGRKFAVSLSPSNAEPGMIESLILSEIAETKANLVFAPALENSELFGEHGMSSKGRVVVLTAALLDDGKGRAGALRAFEADKLSVGHGAYAHHADMLSFLFS